MPGVVGHESGGLCQLCGRSCQPASGRGVVTGAAQELRDLPELSLNEVGGSSAGVVVEALGVGYDVFDQTQQRVAHAHLITLSRREGWGWLVHGAPRRLGQRDARDRQEAAPVEHRVRPALQQLQETSSVPGYVQAVVGRDGKSLQ
ncbi:hypothetical protein [Cryptosporangium minutisporangium]|uniref:hypothetical protein n=1 Tax=Cryptosporangium minutisporangium TaxID=113569 RepID=UPI0031EE6E96